MGGDDVLQKMGVSEGQGVSFSDFWTLIQSLATSQHSVLSGQGGSSCSCILLWGEEEASSPSSSAAPPAGGASTQPPRLRGLPCRCSSQVAPTLKCRHLPPRFQIVSSSPSWFYDVSPVLTRSSSYQDDVVSQIKSNESFVHFGQANFKIFISMFLNVAQWFFVGSLFKFHLLARRQQVVGYFYSTCYYRH